MNLRFENDVKTYSIQTSTAVSYVAAPFENDVKTYSIQTKLGFAYSPNGFENDVKTYSIQTSKHAFLTAYCLRMM